MDYQLVALCCLLFAGFTFAQSPLPQDGAFDLRQCQRDVSGVAKKFLGSITTCIDTMEFKNRKDRAAKLSCIMKCAAVSENLLTKGGLIDAPTIEQFITSAFPQYLFQRGMKMMEVCMSKVQGENTVDPEEEYCRTYSPLIKCVLDGISKVCEDPQEKKKRLEAEAKAKKGH